MDINDDFYLEILAALNQARVQFILISGLAVSYHGYARYTGDMDLWVNAEDANMEKLYTALGAIGYSISDIEGIRMSRDIESPAPIKLLDDQTHFKVDLMTNTFQDRFSWKECHDQADIVNIGEIKIPIVHINHLIEMKEHTNRLDNSMKDLVDAQELKKILKLRGK